MPPNPCTSGRDLGEEVGGKEGGNKRDGNYWRGKLYGRKEWESIRRMGILEKNLRVERVGGNEIIGIIGGKLWPEGVEGYQKYGNHRRENYGRKEW
jgi:hypothetical protein